MAIKPGDIVIYDNIQNVTWYGKRCRVLSTLTNTWDQSRYNCEIVPLDNSLKADYVFNGYLTKITRKNLNKLICRYTKGK